MKDFEIYSPENTISQNLSENTKRLLAITEQEISHLYDLAYEIADGRDLQEILLTLPDLFSVNSLLDVIPQNKDAVGRLHGVFSESRNLLLCYSVCELLRKRQPLTSEAFFADAPISFHENPRIIYQKSGYADSAYLRFSSMFEESHAIYTHGFVSACEDVYNGLCEYCILPVESSAEGLLGSFFKLILKYDLKIAATCDVIEKRDHRTTRFALLRRTLLPIFSTASPNMAFELPLTGCGAKEMANLLFAASFFGVELSNVVSLPSNDGRDNALVRLIFSLTNGDTEAFLMFLSMEFPQYIPIGIYPHLSAKKERM